MSKLINSSVCRIWSRFTCKKQDGTIMKLRVQDMTEENYGNVIDFLMNHFVKYEPSHVFSGVPKSAKAMKDCHEYLTKTLQKPSHKIFICCTDDTDEVKTIIGASVLELITKWQTIAESNFKTEEMKKSYEIYNYLISQCDVMEKYGLNKYYDDRGLAVDANYSSLGVGEQLSRVRRLACKVHGVPMTGAWTMTYGAQVIAERVNWETVFEVNYEDLGRRFGVKFEGVPPTCKLVVGKSL